MLLFFLIYRIAINPFSTGKLKNSIFEIPIIPTSLNINNWTTTSAKSINLHIIRKLIEYFLKNICVKTMFTLPVFEILLFKGRSLLTPAQRGTRSRRVQISVKIKKNVLFLLKLLEKWLIYKLRRFQMVFIFLFFFLFFVFLFCLTLLLKNSIFEIRIIPQTFKHR